MVQQLADAQTIINQAQTHLGIDDLTNLPNMNGQTLIQVLNHTCVGCHVAAHADYDIIKQERDNYKLQLDNHVCSCPKICCVNGDYAEIKQQRDNYQKQINDHKCPSIDNSELENLRAEVEAKNKQIAELEQEIAILKDKPPIQNTTEIARLLEVVAEKEQIIKELEAKLVPNVPQVVENGEIIQSLKNNLVRQERKIERLHVIYLVLLAISMIVGVGAASRKGRLKNK